MTDRRAWYTAAAPIVTPAQPPPRARRRLGLLPEQRVVRTIEGRRFTPGELLSPQVAAAAERVARRLVAELPQDAPEDGRQDG